MCVWCGGGAVALARAEGEEKGKGKELEGDDAVFLKTGLIFGRTIIFESVTFFDKLLSQLNRRIRLVDFL